MKKSENRLFQITEAAHACGLSRSTLMRMEKKGLLTPAHVAPESGRRYYDNHNIARVLQIEKFRAMGLSTEEIETYFVRGGDAAELLAVLESRLHDLLRSVEELRLCTAKTGGLSVQEMTLPAVTCCMRLCEGHTSAEKYAYMYALYGECVRRGFRLSGEPLFTMQDRHDYWDGHIRHEPYPFYVCVPVVPQRKDGDTVTLPECRALSVLYYGDYDEMDEAWLTLGREAKARGLEPAGFPRVLGIVAPYTGREIETQRYCSRIVLPVQAKKESGRCAPAPSEEKKQNP